MIRASLALALVACGAPRPSPCEPAARFEPWDAAPATAPRDPDRPDGGRGAGAADGLIAVYQHWLRRPPLPGVACPFHPTCSVYAREVVRRWGVLGLVLIYDRLFIREHPLAGATYPPICRGGRTRWHDPAP
jgi:putative component of membrane protein insertase Oxa1/YidC/SpoIIIJ protein YidD